MKGKEMGTQWDYQASINPPAAVNTHWKTKCV